MKIKQALGAVLSAAVLAVSALGAALPAAAAQSTAVGLTVRKWNGTTNTEIGSGESLAAGDIVTVSIKLDKPVSNIGGIDFTLGYDTGCFQYQDGSASCLIVDSNGRGGLQSCGRKRTRNLGYDHDQSSGVGLDFFLPLYPCRMWRIPKAPHLL